MIIGVEASNIKTGGGLTHLQELLNTEYIQNGLENIEIEIWGGNSLRGIKESANVTVKIFPVVDKGKLSTLFWRCWRLPKLARQVDIVFAPGGVFSMKDVPYVSMSQNMLVFQKEERNRFPLSFNWLRYNLLEKVQVKSFRNAKGILYISSFARNYIKAKYPELGGKIDTVVYHGISDRFVSNQPKTEFSTCPNFLYVSIVNFYKHQWNAIRAIEKLNSEGFPCTLSLVGPANPNAVPQLEKALKGASNTTYLGKIPFEEIDKAYAKADAFIFASSCENMPNILVEAMSAGLPIFCSNMGPMPEVLADNGEYFDPLDSDSIANSLRPYLKGDKLFSAISEKSWGAANSFSWSRCAEETITFIEECHRSKKP